MADEDRKARLAAIRDKAANKTAEPFEGTPNDRKPEIRFRNYNPQDSSLQKPKKRAHGGDDANKDANDETADENPAKNMKVEKQEQDIIAKELKELASDEINIVPKKPNWDLKQQVSGKLDKLRRRTQRAIVEILREKVASEADID